MLGLSLTVTPMAVAPAAAEETVQVGVNVVNKLDVALAVGPTDVDYSTFEADLRANLKARPVPVADEDLYITAAKAVSANTTSEFTWWNYDHTNPESTATINDFTRQYVEQSANSTTTTSSTGTVQNTNPAGAAWTPDPDNTRMGTTQHPYIGQQWHVVESDAGATMDFYGYPSGAVKDFRYLPNDQKTHKTFEFAIEEFTPYDALDGTGFFFNTSVDEDKPYATGGAGQTMSGYLLFLEYGKSSTIPANCNAAVAGATNTATPGGCGHSMSIYRFSNINTKDFHERNKSSTSSAAADYIAGYTGFTKVAEAPYNPQHKYRRIKLDVYPTYAQAFYNGSTSDSSVMTTPIADGAAPVTFNAGTQITLDSGFVESYGFGPMVSYRGHGCARPTRISLRNLSMTMDKVKTLVEVVDEPEWHDNTKKFLVNLNEETIPDFEETNITARLLNRLRNDDIYYIGWATQDNAEKSVDFLEKNDLKGTVVNMTQDNPDPREVYAPTYAQQIQAIADEIYKQYWVENAGDVVLTTDNVVLSVTGADQTGTADAEYPDGKWKVVHRTSGSDPLTPTDPDRTGDDAFDDDEGIQPWSDITRPDLDVQFDKPGYYDLYYREQYLKTITAHRPPVAAFDVALGSAGAVTFTNTSYDPDFADDLTRLCSGLVTDTCSQWKYLDLDVDTTPHDGVPDTLIEGDTYIVYLTVTDRHGTPVSISKQVRYVAGPAEDCEGAECDVVPDYAAPFADFTLTPTKILPWGDNVQTVTLANRSYDPQGFAVTSTFTLTHDGLPYAGYTFAPGWEQGDIDVASWPVGEYAISLVVANGKKDASDVDLVSAPYVLTFTIVEDNDPPTATADPGPGSYVGNTTVTLRFSDVGDAGLATQRVAVTTSAVAPSSTDPAWTATSASANRPVTVGQTGSYIHWEATDRAGNAAADSFGPYTITKNSTTLALTASPGSGLFTFGTGTVTLTATLSPATPTGSVHFYVGSTYIGSGTISAGVATLAYTPTMAGTVTFTAEYAGDGSHHGSSGALATYAIAQSYDVSAALGQQTDKVYDGDPFEVIDITVTTGGVASTDYALSYAGVLTDGVTYGPTATAPTEAGSYTVTVTTTDSCYVTETDSATFAITKASQASLAVTGLDATYEVDTTSPPTATLGASGGSGGGAVGYAITAQDPAGTATLSGTTVTMNTIGTFTVTATKAADRNYNATTATFDVAVVDTTVPRGTIMVTPDVLPATPPYAYGWVNRFVSSLVFEQFVLGAATFTVEDVTDNSAGTVTVSYLFSDKVLTAAEIADGSIVWTPYTTPVARSSTWKGIMYARLVDPSGNAAYIGSSGVVLYTDVTQRTASFSTARYSTTDQKVPLTFNGNTVASVTVGTVPLGAPVPSTSGAWTGDYTSATPGLTFSGSFLSGLRVGTYTFTISYDPLGETFFASGTNIAMPPDTTVLTVTVTTATPTVTLTAAAETRAARHTETVTLTAAVAGVNGSTPTGTVSFYAVTASQPCGTGPVLSTQTLSGAPVTTTVSSLGATGHTFCAVYSGDVNHTSAADTTALRINDWVTAVALVTAPTKNVYRYGEPLDVTGGVLGLTWSDGSGAPTIGFESLPATAFSYSPTTLGSQTVTVTYAGHSVTFTVTVVDYQVGVVIVPPAKTDYEWGDPLLVAGGTIAQKMASGAVQGQVPLAAAMVAGYTSTQEGNQTLAAANDWGEGSFSGNFTVDVVDPVLEIRVKTPPDKTRYAPGEPLDLTGGEIYVVRKSGTYPMSMTDAMASGYISTQAGSQTVLIDYGGKQAVFTVVMAAPPAPASLGGTGGSGGSTGRNGGAVGSRTGGAIVGEALADGVLEVTDEAGTGVENVDAVAQPVADPVLQESDSRWAPFNIVLVAAGLVLTVCGAVVRRRHQADEAPGRRRRRTVGVAVSATTTLVGVVVLLLVLDPSGRAVVADTWTPLLAATSAGSLGALVWSVRGRAADITDLATA